MINKKEGLEKVQRNIDLNLGIMFGLVFGLLASMWSILVYELLLKNSDNIQFWAAIILTILLLFFLGVGLKEHMIWKNLKKDIERYLE